MSYSAPVGSLSVMSGINDKVDEGDEVILRFTPGAGVNAARGERVVAKLRELVIATRHFKTPTSASWGAGTNRGLLVVRADTKSDNYTLQQIANFMPGIARQAAQATGYPVTFASASNEDGDEAFATNQSGGAPGTTGALSGLTADQVTQWNLLDRITRQNTTDIGRLFGTSEPQFSFQDILNFDFEKLVRSSAPVVALRSLLMYAATQNAKGLVTLTGLFRAKNQGSAEAGRLSDEIASGLRASNENIATVLARVKSYLPGMSGLGWVPAVVAGITGAQWAAIIAGTLVTIGAIHFYLKNMTTNVERGEEFCAARLRATGIKCTPTDFRSYVESLGPDATQVIAGAGKKMAESAGTATSVLLIGAAVLALGYAGYRVLSATGGMQRLRSGADSARTRIKTSVSSARDRVRARLGGSSLRALPASIDTSGD